MDAKKFGKALLLFVVFSLSLGSVYREFSSWLQPAWLTVLCINTLFAVFVFVKPKQIREATPYWKDSWSLSKLQAWFLAHSWRLSLPTVLVLCFVVVVPLLSSIGKDVPALRLDWTRYLAAVIWVPIVEEIVFRRGFGDAFRDWLGPLWGAYFSAVFFSVAHAQPTFYSLIDEGIGIAIGPLLLGFALEAMYSISKGKLWPCILLHACCNFSTVSFSYIDPRWLEWLSVLYI